jgi:periplasmic mercuric ion binding protein
MKTIKKLTLSGFIAIIMILTVKTGIAQDTGTAEIKIKTSAICDMCKETIENHLAFEKGVKKSVLDVKTKIITVTYNPEKTTPEKIRLAISKSGYDADDVMADAKAYKKLDDCCKKGKVCNDKK